MLACAATAVLVFRSLQGHLWLDELLTLTLVQAASLPKLWTGIVTGIDGNPPLYLTLAWLLVHVTPASLSPVAVLKSANVLATMAAMAVLWRVSLRISSPLAAWIGGFLFLALNDNLTYVAFELRTYALYFLLAALAMLLQQRLIERGRGSDLVMLAIVNAALALAHTFGIAYVICIGLAGALSHHRDAWRDLKPTVLAVSPAVVVFVCWLPFFIGQSAVGRPYIWIGRPDLADLLQSIFAAPLLMWISAIELVAIVTSMLWSLRTSGFPEWRSLIQGEGWQPHRYVVLLVVGMLGITLSVWIVSLVLFPLFVPRYFTPQLVITFAINVAFCECALRLVRDSRHFPMRPFARAAIVAAPLLFVAILISGDARRQVPCADSAGAAFESAFVRGDIPVVAESPHIWLPRSYDASHAAAYKFPLDWDVVMKYPERARGNATDFHVMESLKAWSNTTAILPTEQLVRDFPEFLVIEQPGRAWFHNLKDTRTVSAEKLAEAATDSCTLWRVTSVRPRS